MKFPVSIIQQDSLAGLVGVSQQSIFWLEQSDEIEEERLKAVADALGGTPAITRSFHMKYPTPLVDKIT